MASISSLMSSSSSSSSIYGNRTNNIISGLASGMDTEAMIEGMVQGYQQKILKLQQEKTTLQWQQTAYQSISDKLVEFSRKYMSYSQSTTNLMSPSFFNNAVITSAKGEYADKITATGKSSSNIVINGVKQLASAATANTSANKLSGVDVGADGKLTVAGGEAMPDLNGDINISTLQGSMTLKWGSKEVTINFDELEYLDGGDGSGQVTPEQLQKAIAKKLDETEMLNGSGDTVKASELIQVSVDGSGTISFSDKTSGGNSVVISGASGKLKDTLGLADEIKDGSSSFQASEQAYTESVKRAEYLVDQSIQVTFNGTTKTIALKDVLKPDGQNLVTDPDEFVNNLNKQLDKAFGTDAVTAQRTQDGKLSFTVRGDSSLSVQSSKAGALGFEGGLSTYLDTNKTLKELGQFNEKDGTLQLGGVTIQGTLAKNDAGEDIYEYSLEINGEELKFNQDSTIEDIINTINSSDAGVEVSFSKTTNQFNLTAKETGKAGEINIANEGLAGALFGEVKPQPGQDAIFTATINGKTVEYTRSSNTIELDGLTVTLEGTFSAKDKNGNDVTDATNISDIDGTQGVTFTSETDTDKIIDAIKQMVTDYNAIVTEVKKAYTDMPLEKSDGSRYEPLTAEDESDMTESEIAAYEEKAKTGILFMDRDLSNLYSAMRGAVTSNSETAYLRSIGISTSYEEGLTTISLDETKLRQALETEPEKVRDAFTKSAEYGADGNGLMASIQTVTERYAATTGATKGILIEKAGSQYSPTAALNNTMLDKMEEVDKQIASWQSKMSDKVDYYTNKFTQLELLINQMNSQSSALAGLTGGY